MGKEVTVSKGMREATDKLLLVIGGEDPLTPVMQVATRIVAVTEWFKQPEIMPYIKALQNNENGFLADATYDDKVLANVATTALVNGFKLVGNEFNIISGRFYGAKNGYKRKCKEFEDDAYKMLYMGDPENTDVSETPGMVTVPITIRYALADKKTGMEVVKTFRKRIQIAKKSRDSIDTWLGKAHKRAYQRLLSDLSGLNFFFDDNAADGTVAEATPDVGKVSTAKPVAVNPPLAPGAAEGSFSDVALASSDPAAAPLAPPAEAEAVAPEDAAPTPVEPPEDRPERNQANPTTSPAAALGRRPSAKNERF